MKTFHLTIAKVGENLFDGEAASVILPGSEGVFTVLPHHEALVANLKAGDVKVQSATGEQLHFAVPATGLAEVSNNQATVLL